MAHEFLETFSLGFAAESLSGVAFKEAFEDLHAGARALFLCIFGPFEGVFGDAVGEVAVGASTEGSSAKDKFVGANTEGPPVNVACVAPLGEDSVEVVSRVAGRKERGWTYSGAM